MMKLHYHANGILTGKQEGIHNNNKQLLDEVEHDSENYQGRGLCYLPKPKAEADNTNRGLDNFAIMRKPNPVIVLLYNYKCRSVETFHRTTTSKQRNDTFQCKHLLMTAVNYM